MSEEQCSASQGCRADIHCKSEPEMKTEAVTLRSIWGRLTSPMQAIKNVWFRGERPYYAIFLCCSVHRNSNWLRSCIHINHNTGYLSKKYFGIYWPSKPQRLLRLQRFVVFILLEDSNKYPFYFPSPTPINLFSTAEMPKCTEGEDGQEESGSKAINDISLTILGPGDEAATGWDPEIWKGVGRWFS